MRPEDFNDWWDEIESRFMADSSHMSEYHMASVVWDAATKVERTACAKECQKVENEYMAKQCGYASDFANVADECAERIRNRST